MRRILLSAAAAVTAAMLAACTSDPPTGSAAGPAPAAPATATSTAAGPAEASRTAAGTASVARAAGAASGVAPAGTVPLRAPSAYVRSRVDIPQRPSGSATVEAPVPAGWRADTSGRGVGWWSRVGQVDRRDPSGRLLVRVRNQPATGETEDGSLLAVVASFRALPGATVTVRRTPHRASIGLRETDWTVHVPVGGQPRVAEVSAWVLNGQVVIVYASGPADSGTAVRALRDHAADLRIWTHIGSEAG